MTTIRSSNNIINNQKNYINFQNSQKPCNFENFLKRFRSTSEKNSADNADSTEQIIDVKGTVLIIRKQSSDQLDGISSRSEKQLHISKFIFWLYYSNVHNNFSRTAKIASLGNRKKFSSGYSN
uniref:Uncharacterized protein n=1 Tax=Opuntia streptacantha TaxID=393608 RepID=A0A7C8Z2K3_OPUST